MTAVTGGLCLKAWSGVSHSSFYLKVLPQPRSSSSTIPVEASTSGVQVRSSSSRVDSTPSQTTDQRVRIISWNIDGLDTNNIRTRTKAACETILRLLATLDFSKQFLKQDLGVVVCLLCCPLHSNVTMALNFHVFLGKRLLLCFCRKLSLIRCPWSKNNVLCFKLFPQHMKVYHSHCLFSEQNFEY